MCAPDPALLQKWICAGKGRVRLLTIAPELPGAHELLSVAKSSNVFVAMGHSDATFEESHAAVDGGIHYAVHAFNAMRAFSHRDPGIVGEVLSDDRVFAEIIADVWEITKRRDISPTDSWFVACAKHADAELWVSHPHSDGLLANARAVHRMTFALTECDFHHPSEAGG